MTFRFLRQMANLELCDKVFALRLYCGRDRDLDTLDIRFEEELCPVCNIFEVVEGQEVYDLIPNNGLVFEAILTCVPSMFPTTMADFKELIRVPDEFFDTETDIGAQIETCAPEIARSVTESLGKASVGCSINRTCF